MTADAVVVIGGGPVGLTAALAPAEAGVPVRVFEANAWIVEELRASTFSSADAGPARPLRHRRRAGGAGPAVPLVVCGAWRLLRRTHTAPSAAFRAVAAALAERLAGAP